MIVRYVEQAKSGMQFKDRVKAEGILANQTCTLREVHLPWREALPRSASWYYHYQEYPVLQCFWPDKQGCFPWDTHFSKSCRKLQPLLYESVVEKTGLPKSMLVDA